MAELKTQKNRASVAKFLNSVENEQRRRDAKEVAKIMKDITGEKPVMWGDSIVGFGEYHYRYATGREGDWLATGLSPRKQALTLYIMAGFDGYPELMEKLGKYKTGKGCLYINRLEDVHLPTLKQLIQKSYRHVKKHGGC
jgi:hypothetical protein